MMRFPRAILLAAVLATPLALPARGSDVIVYSRVTADGKKLVAPSAEHPVYYLLVSGGFGEAGQTVRGESSPPPAVVEKMVRESLGTQGYVAATKQSPCIDIFIVFNWGYLNPIIVSTFEEGRVDPRNPSAQPPLIEHQEVLNEEQMLGLLGAAALDDKQFATNSQVQQIAQAAGEERYFVVLSAYDFPAITHKVRKLVWRAMMSLPASGTDLTESLPALVKAGAPYFGRESGLPRHVVEPLVPPGRVEIGPAKVEEYLPTIVARPADANQSGQR
jgi:hypothetical protein